MLEGSTAAEPEFAPLLAIARDLRDLPREDFKARLKSEFGKEIVYGKHV